MSSVKERLLSLALDYRAARLPDEVDAAYAALDATIDELWKQPFLRDDGVKFETYDPPLVYKL